MCKPAAEVAGVTKLESHSTRSRALLMWRVASGLSSWGPRETEIIFQSTLDSISEAFDLYHYPLSELMLAARAEIWESGCAPDVVKNAVKTDAITTAQDEPPSGETVLLGGELWQSGNRQLIPAILAALEAQQITALTWLVPTGALSYALGAQEIARDQAERVVGGLRSGNAKTIIADGPETAWALRKIYPRLGVPLPDSLTVKTLSEVLATSVRQSSMSLGKVFVHDSRAACLIADRMANHLAILPGYRSTEEAFGLGEVYEAPRRLIDRLGGKRVFNCWTRSLAKSSGSDDGLWLTYPELAAELALGRLRDAKQLGADLVVTDSPLAATFLRRNMTQPPIEVAFLAELAAKT
jgi:hypothetical protein